MISCIVIGAGPGGIVATKELLEKGFDDVLCLEQSDRLGGVFSNSYDNLLLTSSVTFSIFSDFWVGEGKSNHFWTKEEAVNYWENYSKHFGVTDRIRFGTRVEAVSFIDEGSFRIELNSGDTLECERLILAIGNNNIPKFPEWIKKLSSVISYSHSKDYKNSEPFKGKRVLVVGGGESGSDVALEISQVAEKCWVSLRETTGWVVPRKRGENAADVSTHRGIWDLPREFGKHLSPFVLKLERSRKDPVFDALADLNEKVSSPFGIWGIYGTKTLSLPKAIANHGCIIVGDITSVEDGGRKLKTIDGECLNDIDCIVFCTGYRNVVNFMPEEFKACKPREMYKHMFHPNFGDRLAWIGWARPGFGSQFPIMEMQSRYCALIFNGELKLPNREEIISIARKDQDHYQDQFKENALRIQSLIDYHWYIDDLAKIIGCKPPLIQYFFLHPRLWLHIMYGPTQATQFRLCGPGKKVKLSREIIFKLPLSSFNHIVKAGLRGRIRYALKAILPKFIRN